MHTHVPFYANLFSVEPVETAEFQVGPGLVKDIHPRVATTSKLVIGPRIHIQNSE